MLLLVITIAFLEVEVNLPFKFLTTTMGGDIIYLMTDSELEQGQAPELSPLEIDPPTNKWTRITYIDGKTGSKVEIVVPFESDEVSVLKEGREANRRLVKKGADGSGAEREYWIDGGQFYPDEKEWQDRQETIRLLRISSRSASKYLAFVQGYSRDEARSAYTQASIADFITVRDTPGRLRRHESTRPSRRQAA